MKRPHGECILDTGNYIFNTEAHPVDADALKCCYDQPREQLIPSDFSSDDYLGEIMQSEQQRHTTTVPNAETTNSVDNTESGVNTVHAVNSSSNKLFNKADEDDEDDQEDDSYSMREENMGTVEVVESGHDSTSEYEVVTEINRLVSTKYKNITEVLESSLDAVGEWLKGENARSELLKIIGELETTSEQIKTATETITTTVDENGTGAIQIDSVDDAKSNINETLQNKRRQQQQQQQGQTKTDWLPALRSDEVLHETPIEAEESPSSPREFDVQRLIEKVRRMYISRTKRPQDFELLSCRSQSYLQRLAIHGEILT